MHHGGALNGPRNNTGFARPVACLSALAMLLGACPEQAATPVLHSLDPGSVKTGQATEITISGEGLYDRALVELDSSRATRVKRAWLVRIGDVLTIDDVKRVNAKALRFTLPADVPIGEHVVQVITPSGATLSLAAKLTVGDGRRDLHLQLATQAGEALGERTLYVGETLDVVAQFRDAQDAMANSDAEINWTLSEPVAELSASDGASVQLRATAPGDTRLVATASTGERVELLIHVLRADPTRMRLQLESAAGGAGDVLPAARTLTGDEVLDCWTTMRSLEGEFLRDVPASYRLEVVAGGDDAKLEVTGAHAQLTPGRTGTLKLIANFGELPEQSIRITVVPGRTHHLVVQPSTAQLRIGDAPLQFSATGRDIRDNPTEDLGELAWSALNDTFGDIDAALGLLTPRRAGAGLVRVVSSNGAAGMSGMVQVLGVHAISLSIENVPSAPLRAGGPDHVLSVRGVDETGETNSDVGTLTWSLVNGSFGELAAGGVVSPRTVGSAMVRVRSSYGFEAISPTIRVVPGALATLNITPDTLLVSADAPAVQFQAAGSDAFGNATTDLGTITWAIDTGTFGALDATGKLTPTLAGSGTVRAQSSLGASGTTGAITITPGRAVSLQITPQSWTGMAGDDAQSFATSGVDADGNVTSDVGSLSYAIASGPIRSIDASTGVFTPLIAGDGKISVSNDSGLSAQTQNIHVDAFSLQTTLSALRVPALFRSQKAARIELDVQNMSKRELVTTGAYFTITSSSDFSIRPDWHNDDRVPAQSTRTLVFWLDVGPLAPWGLVNITANLDVFHALGGFTSLNRSTSSAVSLYTGPTIAISAPALPGNRVCTGSAAAFAATSSLGGLGSYAWLLRGGSPATSLMAAPIISYLNPGAFAYSASVTDSRNLTNTALAAQPIFASAAQASPGPTGSVVFRSPSAGQAIAMTSLPRADLLGLDLAHPLRGCDGSPLGAGKNQLTVFVDRGALDASADVDANTPGIQLTLAQGDADLPPILWNPNPAIEGDGLAYAEYFDAASGQVTASGYTTFSMTKDTQKPSVTLVHPSPTCTGNCLHVDPLEIRAEPLVFRFSEPMDRYNVEQEVDVRRVQSTSCSESNDIGLTTSEFYYDDASRTLLVYPVSLLSSVYPVRIAFGSNITDAAVTPNALSPVVFCTYIAPLGAAPSTTAPRISTPPAAFSPDGDGSADTTQWQATADANARVLDLRVLRGNTILWASKQTASGGANTISWDGRDSYGRIVAPGFYRYELRARNRAHDSSPASSGVVEVKSAVRWTAVPRRY